MTKNMATVRSFDIIPDECNVVGSCKGATEINTQKYIIVLYEPYGITISTPILRT
jgi:hypothetical protein